MRLVAFALLGVALAAAAWSGHMLWEELQQDADLVGAEILATTAEPRPSAASAPPRRWPALFGEPQPPAPSPPEPAAPREEPQPPAQPQPPLTSLGYSLRGVVRSGDSTWAMVSHPTGEILLRPGQSLAEGVDVVRVDEAGVWVSRQGGEAELLGFPD
ncbi:type II secretion system protein N [Maritimibacter alkaliphilus]|uniref:type II secretion system protein N n=1 Tax=Maritimibacter alkaliphilus TaxID=404236 RepID=UPI001C96E910|nr:type II secretion system protein N [Maritimibacter alkaliphilus]MBY6092504.1 hypothetical protein [Maritimibacter alkaliphilus]